VPHPSSVFCSMGGRPQRPTIGKSPFCLFLGREFTRAASYAESVRDFSPLWDRQLQIRPFSAASPDPRRARPAVEKGRLTRPSGAGKRLLACKTREKLLVTMKCRQSVQRYAAIRCRIARSSKVLIRRNPACCLLIYNFRVDDAPGTRGAVSKSLLHLSARSCAHLGSVPSCR